jgi:hypothetical protein
MIVWLFHKQKEIKMTIRIIDDECTMAGNQGTIIVEGDNPEVVSNTATKHEVLAKATAMGLSRVGISGQGGAYPVDAEGKELSSMPGEGSEMVKYRNDFQVTSGI